MITLYQIRNHKRSAAIIKACSIGLKEAGHKVQVRWNTDYKYPETSIAVFYGYCDNFPMIMREYETAIYIDLGYWGRTAQRHHDGYHKICVNSRHPTEYLMKTKRPDARWKRLDIRIQPWRMGDHVLVTGMSGKGAVAEGYLPSQWEEQVIEVLNDNTRREIRYRPKPNWAMSKPIPGSIYCNDKSQFPVNLEDCHAVVAHHSNCAIDAILNGVPAFVVNGAATPMASQNFANIEEPYYPENRYQWACNLAYTQFTRAELMTSLPWDILAKEGLM